MTKEEEETKVIELGEQDSALLLRGDGSVEAFIAKPNEYDRLSEGASKIGLFAMLSLPELEETCDQLMTDLGLTEEEGDQN